VLAGLGEAAPAAAPDAETALAPAAPAPAKASPAGPAVQAVDPEFGWDEEPPEFE